MARKGIELFSVSFLDLLSGALGAVILLYVIVPRITISAEELEEQKKLSEEVKRLGLDIEKLKDVLPQDKFSQVQQQMQDVLKAKADIEARITNLQRRLRECTQLKDRNQEAIEELQQQLEAEKSALKQCESDYARIEGSGKFALITMSWNTTDDVDLHIIDPDGRLFNYEHKTNPGSTAELTLDNTQGPGLEVWSLINPPPGRYTLYSNLYKKRSATSPLTEVRVYHRNGVKEYPTFTLTTADESAASKKLIGTFEVPPTGPLIVN